jgi:opacity protein-like surface antigen
MKNVFSAAILFTFLLAQTAHAQVRFGITGGYDVVNNEISSQMLNLANRNGFQVGFSIEALTKAGIGLETGLLYGHQEYAVMMEPNDIALSLHNEEYLMLPLNLKLKFEFAKNFGIYGIAGAYGSMKIKGKEFEDNLTEAATDVWKNIKAKDFQAGVNAGAGLFLFNHLDIGLHFRYQVTDNFENYKPEVEDLTGSHEKNWQVHATLFF